MAGDSDNARSLTPLRHAGRTFEPGLIDNPRIGARLPDQGNGKGRLSEGLHTGNHEPWSLSPQTCRMVELTDSATHFSRNREEAI
ncbi:hypothetical protein BC443_13605 [Salinicola sp. MIT1003]|nr:hypothetical protein BC443_13605 [Salinicola sp. MIT1003]